MASINLGWRSRWGTLIAVLSFKVAVGAGMAYWILFVTCEEVVLRDEIICIQKGTLCFSRTNKIKKKIINQTKLE